MVVSIGVVYCSIRASLATKITVLSTTLFPAAQLPRRQFVLLLVCRLPTLTRTDPTSGCLLCLTSGAGWVAG